MRQAARGQESWVRRVEHLVLRIVSLGFSLASAHAIRWFFAPLDGVDRFQPFITWVIAIGFGVLGYFVSRGLAHRLMQKESIWSYAPICVAVEFVEIFCNYALAAAVIQRAAWLLMVSPAQRAVLTFLTYVALSIIPLISVLLAVVDMDLERKKGHSGERASAPVPVGNGRNQQPKFGGAMTTTGAGVLPQAVYPAQTGRPAVAATSAQRGTGQSGQSGQTSQAATFPLPGVRPVTPVSSSTQ